MTRTMGDKLHTVTTRVDQSGIPETVETFTNIDEGNYQTLLCSHVKKKWLRFTIEESVYFFIRIITVVFITIWNIFGVTLREITLIKNLTSVDKKKDFDSNWKHSPKQPTLLPESPPFTTQQIDGSSLLDRFFNFRLFGPKDDN